MGSLSLSFSLALPLSLSLSLSVGAFDAPVDLYSKPGCRTVVFRFLSSVAFKDQTRVSRCRSQIVFVIYTRAAGVWVGGVEQSFAPQAFGSMLVGRDRAEAKRNTICSG